MVVTRSVLVYSATPLNGLLNLFSKYAVAINVVTPTRNVIIKIIMECVISNWCFAKPENEYIIPHTNSTGIAILRRICETDVSIFLKLSHPFLGEIAIFSMLRINFMQF